ncbi:T6SS effector BTH_I2691 family protein [Acinetobacter indicus]|uniref:T6SS effector BTH_I2691 family protein n=1 Tax=Acinetobacter indicus TaxID=756892 RepID=UPI0025753033|nr:T6SS effector BTH_I2691 family protein [Acinetobacter indicus]MDM1302255.1 hypothetical protein [Acinetobacter indicus]
MGNEKKIPVVNQTNNKAPLFKYSQKKPNDKTVQQWSDNLKKYGLVGNTQAEKLSLDPNKNKLSKNISSTKSPLTQGISSNKQNSTAKQNAEKCSNFCKESGFWILPLKYGIEKKGINVPILPESLKKDYSGLQLNNFNYVAQMVTEGFIYVCIKRQGQAKADWLGYRATKNGYMSYFNVTKPVESDVPNEFACHKEGHSAMASVITLPNKNGKKIIAAYLLFTHDQISTNKIKEYESNAEAYAKNKKWQKIDPNQWEGSQKSDNCLSANGLQYIYNSNKFNAKNEQKGKNVNQGRWEIIKGVFQSKPKFCAALVLHDPIGITKKLNESRNAQFSSLMKFLSEGNNQHKFESSQTVDSLQTIIENKLIRQNLTANVNMNDQTIKLIYAKDKIPQFATNIDQREYQKRVNEIWEKASEAEKKKAIEQYHKKYDVEKTEGKIITAAKDKANSEWNQKYKDRFNWDAKNTFDKKVKSHIDVGVNSSANYAKDHLIWIQSKQLLNALYVYDQTEINSYGAAFYTRVMNIMHGMTGTDAGQNLMEKWLLQDKVTPENLYLRAVLYNQKELFNKFESAVTSTVTLDWDQNQSTIKDFINAMFAADSAWEQWLKLNGDKVEKLAWYNPANGVMFISAITRTTVKWSLKYNTNDTISKGLSRISLIAYAHGGILKDKVPKYSLLYNADLRMAKQGSSLSATQIQTNWKNLQSNTTAKKIKEILSSSSTATSLRISSVVALLELINFGTKGGKLLNDPNWENSTGAIAGMFSLTAATLDISSNGMEALSFAQKAEKIKIYGASFAVAGSVFSFFSDFIGFKKEKNGWIAALLFIKLGSSFAMIGVGLGIIVQLPILKSKMIELSAKYILLEKLIELQVMRAAAILNWFGLSLTILIIILKKFVLPNDLQVWCSNSAWGMAKDSDKYKTLELEEKAFNEAIQGI